ncbi:MAG: carboxypeptidase-like regulatory domain-containing protein, partial [Bacteroidales bacterium]|nr:carboxypeptidase-like regulatory domain-containing protein [Bacteroidales bacterium]
MKKIIFIFFVSFLLIKVNAQNSISGSITDETHQPLVGVSIYIPDMHKGCVSDQKGNYELTNLPNGKIKI